MAEYKKCYVAFLDLLGFKKMVNTKTCDEILKVYETVKMPTQVKDIYVGTQQMIDMSNVHSKIMSDSVCLYVETFVENGLAALILLCLVFQQSLFALPCPVLVRGAIVSGDIYEDGDIIFGNGITESYLLEENNAKYPRIIINRAIIDEGKKNTSFMCTNAFDFATIEDDDSFFIVDYFKKIDDKENASVEQIMDHIYSVLDTSNDNSIREKYLYLKKWMSRKYPDICR